MSEYQFTNKWFEGTRQLWDQLIGRFKPTRMLEIGSYEGASTCYLIDSISATSSMEIHCVDSWEGGVEHKDGGFARSEMSEVEKRFIHNTNLAIAKSRNKVEVVVHKGYSDVQLAKLVAEKGLGYFDLIYVDGSHQAPDVLCDAILGFKLLKKDGVIVFDDYVWQEENLPGGVDPIRCPKMAIDAFTTIFCRKIRIIRLPLYQLYVQKIAD